MKRVLFVDDELEVLNGLQRSLGHRKPQWEMAFADSGAMALTLLEIQPFDVIVSDLKMPQMDGAELLKKVRALYPGVIRIALSGYVDREVALRSAGIVHQYLSKPCDSEQLIASIERFGASAAVLPDEAIRRAVRAIGSLPSLSQTAAALIEAIEKTDASFNEIAAIVSRDVSMAAKVLQLVNSPLFAVSGHVTSVTGALVLMGLDSFKTIVLSAEVLRSFEPARPIAGFSLADFQDHSALTSRIAATLPVPKSILPATATAALLHDIGKLVLAKRLPLQFERNLMAAREHGWPLHLVESDSFGASHAEIGAYLLSLWGLSPSIIEAVWRHHRPQQAEPVESGLHPAGIVHVADAFAHELSSANQRNDDVCELLDTEYLAAQGVADELPAWRNSLERMPSGWRVQPAMR